MKRSHLAKIAITLLLSLSSIGIVGGGFFLKKAFSNSGEPEIVTDTTRYHKIREQLGYNNYLIKHFPGDIPVDAKGVRIAYSPASSIGNSFFQIRLKQPPEKIKKSLLQYQKIAKHQYKGGSTNDHANSLNGVPTTFFYTNDTTEESFPPSYEILVLDAKDKGSPGFNWSHGDSYGVAINSSASEIVYWFEKW
ncbi:hypothetical protein [Calothrix sp. PCC 7507]|uniref:hypothetical protein n=1 Tax=Calothrix sp. PCC 7507 TaxID=99598 RepID=UPI00029ECC2F|nr:hypothetical protein [Calothrix sp. PCC 7507]AFY35256.1 hypothetical protein Cal7507_4904 [Calothrix sp. PCC 7507]